MNKKLEDGEKGNHFRTSLNSLFFLLKSQIEIQFRREKGFLFLFEKDNE